METEEFRDSGFRRNGVFVVTPANAGSSLRLSLESSDLFWRVEVQDGIDDFDFHPSVLRSRIRSFGRQ